MGAHNIIPITKLWGSHKLNNIKHELGNGNDSMSSVLLTCNVSTCKLPKFCDVYLKQSVDDVSDHQLEMVQKSTMHDALYLSKLNTAD